MQPDRRPVHLLPDLAHPSSIVNSLHPSAAHKATQYIRHRQEAFSSRSLEIFAEVQDPLLNGPWRGGEVYQKSERPPRQSRAIASHIQNAPCPWLRKHHLFRRWDATTFKEEPGSATCSHSRLELQS